MKRIETILFTLYNLIVFGVTLTIFLGIAIIAEQNSWYYLLLYVPILLFIYHTESMNFRKKKAVIARRKS